MKNKCKDTINQISIANQEFVSHIAQAKRIQIIDIYKIATESELRPFMYTKNSLNFVELSLDKVICC